jgi:hypothetical protein
MLCHRHKIKKTQQKLIKPNKTHQAGFFFNLGFFQSLILAGQSYTLQDEEDGEEEDNEEVEDGEDDEADSD